MRYLFCLLFLFVTLEANGFPPSYYKITNPKLRKAKFVEIILPLIQEENKKIMNERKFILNFFAKDFLSNFDIRMNQEAMTTLSTLAQKYQVDNMYDKDAYLSKINKIPPSLAISQGALESAWGSSRFVKLGNNIFGQWTWVQEQGIVPTKREEGKTHMLKIFDSLQESVSSYMLNLNRNDSYEEFRKKRANIKNFNGIDACKTMTNYSQLGEEYIDRLMDMINKNNLLMLDY